MPASLSLLCVPCAGASATMYLRWRRHLPRWIDLVPVELPGRGSRIGEDFVEDHDRLVARLCAEHEPSMRGAYAIFGHSMGSLLAYGMTRHRRAAGARLPVALFASGGAAPSKRNAEYFVGKDTDEALVRDLRDQGGTPDEVFANEELMRITLDVLRADYRVCEGFQYRPAPALPVPLHVFAGRQDDIDVGHVHAWKAEADGVSTVDWFDGGHFFIKQQEAKVLDMLVLRLTQSTSGGLYAPRAFA